MKYQNGYTLIELMIVLSTISILAAVAMPAYVNYQVRAKSLDGLNISSIARIKITEYYRYTGALPINNKAAGIPMPDKIQSKWIESVTIENGVIQALFNNVDSQLAGKYLTLRPVTISEEPTAPVYFSCGYAEPKDKNQQIHGKNKTNIEKKYLPSACR